MSSVIPSVFNRIDFWAMLLPGYVLIILGLVFFSPSLFSSNQDTFFEIFSSVVFVVAGPAIGFTLSQAVSLFSFLIFFRNKFERNYYLRTLICEFYVMTMLEKN
jgi:hypothetical protein